MTHFRSRRYDGMFFVDSKLYLLAALLLYLASIYLCDLVADYLSYYLEIVLINLFDQRGTIGWLWFMRRIVLGEILPLFFFIIIPVLFFRIDRVFFYTGFRRFEEKYVTYSFLRLLGDIILSSIWLIILFGFSQGIFFWLGSFWSKWGYNDQISLLKYFNLSTLLICIIRSGIIVTIIQGLIYHDKREKLTPAPKIIICLIPLILAAVMLIPQHITYIPKVEEQKPSAVNPSVVPTNIPDKKEKFEPINGGYPSFFNDEENSKNISRKHNPKILSHKYQPMKQ